MVNIYCSITVYILSMASLGAVGADRPWRHHPGGDTRMKFLKNVAEFRKNTGQTPYEGGS